jgi:predicted dehydrogenase
MKQAVQPFRVGFLGTGNIIEQAAARGVTIGVNHSFLFAPTYENLRNDLNSGKLGRPDHITITWNRALDQLQSGPFDLWMLRDPWNIVLEIGPHCLESKSSREI